MKYILHFAWYFVVLIFFVLFKKYHLVILIEHCEFTELLLKNRGTIKKKKNLQFFMYLYYNYKDNLK